MFRQSQRLISTATRAAARHATTIDTLRLPRRTQRHAAQAFQATSLRNHSFVRPLASLPSKHPVPYRNADTELQPPRAQTQDQISGTSALQQATGRDLVLSPPALIVTREYEWANILVGFEQANKYSIRSAPGGEVVGHLAEESSIGRTITRNFLRTHRPFKATVFDKHNNIVFVMRRPMYLISTQIFVETPEGDVLGEVHMDWHLWRRRYKLFVEKEQFSVVDSGFLAVDFDMRDAEGKKIASVNKDFTGFARELFTDARQYVLRLDPSFGLQPDEMLVNDATTINVPTEHYSEFKMGHRERAVILAAAISIDFDYFSMHSGRGMNPALMMMPHAGGGAGVPPPVGAPGAVGGAGAAAGADALSDGENPYSVPVDDGGSAAEDGDFNVPADEAGPNADSEWAQFEEADHGFDETFQDDGAWSSSNETWSDGGGGEEGGGGLFGLIKDIFFSE